MILNSAKWVCTKLRDLRSNQRGVTGLETAIILIAFVVVASVFGYVVLTTGIFATEKGKDATMAGLEQVRTTLQQRSGVTTVKSLTENTIDRIKLRVSSMPGGAAVDPVELSVHYQDSTQMADPAFNIVQIRGDDDLSMESGELFELDVDLSGLNPPLGANIEFRIIVQPANGSPLYVQRTTALSLDSYNYLD